MLLALISLVFPSTKTAAQNQKVLVFEIDPELSKPKSSNESNVILPTPTTNKTKNDGRNLEATKIYVGTHYSKEEVIQLIKDYSVQYGISAALPLRVAKCESGFNWNSKNSHSTASGVFQYIHSTWINTEAGKQGMSPFDADANVQMAIKSIASGGISNWNASKKCWQNS